MVALALLLVGLGACSDEAGTGGADTPKPPPQPLAPLGEVVTTETRRLAASRAPIEPLQERNPSDPAALEQLLADGFGDEVHIDGEPPLPLTLDEAAAPTPGPNARLLTRFVHLADIQLADDESPSRFAAFDVPGLMAFRPQEGHECRILNAAVRTINKLSEAQPIDLVVLGGDNVDNAQDNEHDWLRAVLTGADAVECDSGADDDPIPGPDNDPKDPFVAEGLTMPWLWVTGNHDVLNQGIAPIAGFVEVGTGTDARTGTRDWSQPGGPVVKGEIVADPRRVPLGVDEILARLADDGDGHGIDGAALARGKASYSYDIADSSVRMLVVDSATPNGGTEGVITQRDLDEFVVPELERAANDGKLVIVASHHSTNTFANADTPGMDLPADLVSEQGWRDLMASYPNVLVHLTGHSHIHRVHRRQATDATPYWEVITSALSDYPHHMRLVEVWDQDNGFVSVRLVNLDYSVEGDPVAADGRRRAVSDMTSGWMPDQSGDADDRNVELFVPKPSP
jgi:3',5'-cyclic AMP phosphodiesterase CpdA